MVDVKVVMAFNSFDIYFVFSTYLLRDGLFVMGHFFGGIRLLGLEDVRHMC